MRIRDLPATVKRRWTSGECLVRRGGYKALMWLVAAVMVVVVVVASVQASVRATSASNRAVTLAGQVAEQQRVAAGLAVQAKALAERLDAGVKAQLANRVRNVATWCNAINQSRDYARVLRKSAGQTPYLLADLDCVALERGTAMSARPHAPPRFAGPNPDQET